MKNMLLKLLISFCCLCVFVAVGKDVLYDTPQRCQDLVAPALGAQGERADAFTNGDWTLTYKIYFMSLFPVGTLKISRQKQDQGPAFALEALTDGSPAAIFVRASARLESFFDKESHLPNHYAETTKVKETVKSKDIVFDRQQSLALRDKKMIRINADTYDPAGAFVAATQLPYQDNQEYALELLSKDSLYILKGQKMRSAPRYIEVNIHLSREDMTSTHGAELHVWLTRDAARIPLVIKSWMPAGYASVVLEKIEAR
jgi:hypothetical protein